MQDRPAYNCSAHWSVARLTKRAAPLINLSVALHLANCAIFNQSHSALAIAKNSAVNTYMPYVLLGRLTMCILSTLAIGLGLGLRLGLGLGLELVSFRVRVRLRLGLGLPNMQRVWSNMQIDQMRLT